MEEAWLELDRLAWEAELTFMGERARLLETGEARAWTRDELYDDRVSR